MTNNFITGLFCYRNMRKIKNKLFKQIFVLSNMIKTTAHLTKLFLFKKNYKCMKLDVFILLM